MTEYPDDWQTEARDLAERVDSYLRRGALQTARRAFNKSWRDAVPELPLRFSVILVRPERSVVVAILHMMRNGQSAPQLGFVFDDGAVAVHRVDTTDRLGQLPTQDARLLSELGAGAELYTPHLLEIRTTSAGRLDYVAVELVRPEERSCLICGEPAQEGSETCALHARKRRLPARNVHQAEDFPVPFHEALDALANEAPDAERD
jgi:hypothetical protein